MSPINWNLPRRKRSIGKNSRNNKLYRKDINYMPSFQQQQGFK